MSSDLTNRTALSVELAGGGPMGRVAFVAGQRSFHRSPHDRMQKTRRIGSG
jgi:hypothetical protein